MDRNEIIDSVCKTSNEKILGDQLPTKSPIELNDDSILHKKYSMHSNTRNTQMPSGMSYTARKLEGGVSKTLQCDKYSAYTTILMAVLWWGPKLALRVVPQLSSLAPEAPERTSKHEQPASVTTQSQPCQTAQLKAVIVNMFTVEKRGMVQLLHIQIHSCHFLVTWF